MRNTTFLRTLSCRINLLFLVALGMVCLPTIAQDAATPSAPAKEAPAAALPSDPKELMLLAAKVNGLTGDDVKPWHLKASFKAFDEQGMPREQGTYEEFWVNFCKEKQFFNGSRSSAAIYRANCGFPNGGLDVVPGDAEGDHATAEWIGRVMKDIHTNLDFPLSSDLVLDEFRFRPQEATSLEQTCVAQLGYPALTDQHMPVDAVYCFDNSGALLRSTILFPRARESRSSNSIRFEGHILPGDLEVRTNGKTTLSVHLERIELLSAAGKVDFDIPKDRAQQQQMFLEPPAVKQVVPHRKLITLTQEEAMERVTKKVDPKLPEGSSEAGTVVFEVTIGKTGRITMERPVSGPVGLSSSVMNALLQWEFNPYLFDGTPIEVKTTFTFTF